MHLLGTEIDVRKVTRYPPEYFISAQPTDLAPGDNKVAVYAGFSPYVIVLQGAGFTPNTNLSFSIDADGYTDSLKMSNLYAAKGINYDEDFKLAAVKTATLRLYNYSSTTMTGYAWWHRVGVFKPTVAMKMQLGLRLSPDEVELASKYGIAEALQLNIPSPFDPYSGIEEYRVVTASLTSSGTILRLAVPTGKKIVLVGVGVQGASAPAQAYLSITRDDVDLPELDFYCLPGPTPGSPGQTWLRVVSVSKLEVDLDARASGTYYVRLVYGIGRLTVREKVAWGLELTPAERQVAESQELYEKVEAGVQ
jgi:hypothetical protein